MTNGKDFAFSDTATRLRQSGENGIIADHPPLTKREYFAAMAMQGLLASWETESLPNPNHVAKHSVTMADELIKALNETS